MSPSDLLSIQVAIPDTHEQEKIGLLLKHLDNLIAVNQRKNLGNQHKSTYAWEKRTLGELAEVRGGGTPSSEKQEYWNGKINWFTPTEVSNQGYLTDSTKKISDAGLAKSSAKLMPPGTVLMTSRAGVGDMGILTQEASTNQGFQSLIPNEDVPPYFLYSMQEIISKKANLLASGSTFTEISGKQVAKIPISVPNSEAERKQIGSFFFKLDNLIAVNQRKGDLWGSAQEYESSVIIHARPPPK